MRKFWHSIMGVAFIALGILIIDTREYTFSQWEITYHLDTTMAWIFGLGFIVYGMVWLGLVIKRWLVGPDEKELAAGRYLVCPKCEEPYMENTQPENKCPRCHVELEPLPGFYERHPELVKDDPEDKK